jgi:hypothetical protein
MTSRRPEIVAWAVFAFIIWNVVFDRAVALAGSEFARDQILRYEQGEAVSTIAAAFTPRVGDAALAATGWTGLVAAIGAAVVLARGRRSEAPTAPTDAAA